MALERRTEMYRTVEVDGNEEIDHLTSNFNMMDLTTVANERITSMTERRIDLISFKYYKNYNYAWLILEHNGIIDPYEEISIGDVLKIPSLEDYFRFKNRNKRRRVPNG